MREAIDYLNLVYNDPDSSPMGIYDATMATVASYQHENYTLSEMDESLVIRLAKSYIDRII